MHDTKSKTKLTLRTQSITQMLQAKYDTHIKKHDTKKYNERPLKKNMPPRVNSMIFISQSMTSRPQLMITWEQ